MRTACSLGSLLSIKEVLACSRRLATSDVDTIWIPETWGMENFAMLSAVSGAASAPRIGSSIVNVYSRSPAAIAMGAATVDAISGGRLVLGLGASSPAIVRGLHGMQFEKPLRRTRESVEIVRLAMSGKRLDYRGKIFDLGGFGLLIKPVRDRIPIYLAAVNPAMTNLAWEIADGVIFYLRPVDEMSKTIRRMRDGSRRKIDVACQLITCVSDDEDAAMDRARRTISFYVAVGGIYRAFLERNGFGEQTSAIHDEFKKNGLGNIHGLVTDRMVHSLAVVGTPDRCLRKLDEFRRAGLDLPILQFNPVGRTAESFEIFAGAFFDGGGEDT